MQICYFKLFNASAIKSIKLLQLVTMHKNKNLLQNYNITIVKYAGDNIVKFYFNYSAKGTIETNDLLLVFLLNSTIPSVKANKVWSFPIPTFKPG